MLKLTKCETKRPNTIEAFACSCSGCSCSLLECHFPTELASKNRPTVNMQQVTFQANYNVSIGG